MINTINIMTKNDECYTKYEDALELVKNIEKYYPNKNIKIWCPFCCNLGSKVFVYEKGSIPNALVKKGYSNLICTANDFYSYSKEWVKENKIDLIIDNPPFSKRTQLLEKLISLDIPFIILQGAQQWFSNQKCIWWLSDYSQYVSLLLPNKRLSFNRPNQPNQKTNPAFFSFWLCYKTNLPNGFISYEKV